MRPEVAQHNAHRRAHPALRAAALAPAMSSLRKPVTLDPVLSQVAAEFASHRFLAGATQGCYLRLVDLLCEVLQAGAAAGEPLRVLDWGCGKGHISHLLRSRRFEVVSADRRNNASDSAFGQETPILVRQAIPVLALEDPVALPFEDASLDVVLSFGVLEHVENDAASLCEIRRVLKPGGVFFFCFLPYRGSWVNRLAHWRGDRYHPVLYRHADVRRLASVAGFECGPVWHGQLLPKNRWPHSNALERVDRWLTSFTPLRFIATNLEGFLIAR